MYLICTRMCDNKTCQYKYPHDVKHFNDSDFVEMCIFQNDMYHFSDGGCAKSDKWVCFQPYQNKQKEE